MLILVGVGVSQLLHAYPLALLNTFDFFLYLSLFFVVGYAERGASLHIFLDKLVIDSQDDRDFA